MPRVLVLNNYPLDALWNDVNQGQAPDHLLFGVNRLAGFGWKPTFLPFGNRGIGQLLNQLLRSLRFPVPAGDLQQQRHALRHLDNCDLIYAACQTQAHSLSYLRAVGLVKRPIVCLAHHPMNRGRLGRLRAHFLRWQLQGTDAFPSLSKRVSEEINAIAPGKSAVLPWGPDASFYGPVSQSGSGVVAAGRTGRDYVTFGLGASQSKTAARIICLERNVSPTFSRFGPNVEVHVQPNNGWMQYPQLLREYATARALAIPLDRQVSLAGLSSLADALGMGKPVLMTRHPLIDFDIEELGIGKWIEPGDVQGWRDALTWIDQNPEEAQAMGRRARKLVDEGLNSETFATRLKEIFERLSGTREPFVDCVTQHDAAEAYTQSVAAGNFD